MEKLVNACIRRDVEDLTGGNGVGVAESIEQALEVQGFKDFVPFIIHEPLMKIAKNLKTVYNKYFVGTESSGKAPIDLYIYVFENGIEILKELTDGLETDSVKNVMSYYMRLQFEFGLRDFPMLLLKVGEFHKFDKAKLREDFLADDIDFEED